MLQEPAPGQNLLEGAPDTPQVSDPPLEFAARSCSLRCLVRPHLPHLTRLVPPGWVDVKTFGKAGEESHCEQGAGVAELGEGAPSLTSAVGIEEAQGHQGACHQQQQKQQPPFQEAWALLH